MPDDPRSGGWAARLWRWLMCDGADYTYVCNNIDDVDGEVCKLLQRLNERQDVLSVPHVCTHTHTQDAGRAWPGTGRE